MDDQDAQAADVNHEDLLGRRLIVKEHDGLPFGFRITETRWAKMHKLQALMASLEAK